jgi:hypothetical protein
MHVDLENRQQCNSGVHQWLMNNGLLLNLTKSDVVQFTTGKGRSRPTVEEITTVCVHNVAIQPSKPVKSLGVTLDENVSFDEQVDSAGVLSNTCSTSHP